jgi:hypothetical protein
MDFIGGALPNVMFLIGVIAIGIGLGLEFKIIEVKNGLSKGGRIGACVVGVALVATSIALYLRPAQTAHSPAAAVAAAAATSTPLPLQGAADQSVPTAAPTEAATAAPTDTLTAVPTEVSTTVPTDTPTAAPTELPTPTPTAVPTVEMPDIRGLSPKDAARRLAEVGLQLGEPQESCAVLGVGDELIAETRKNRIACQSVAPGGEVALESSIAYALTEE